MAHINWGGFWIEQRDIDNLYSVSCEILNRDETMVLMGLEIKKVLDLLHAGVQEFGYPSASLFLQSAQFADGQPLRL